MDQHYPEGGEHGEKLTGAWTVPEICSPPPDSCCCPTGTPCRKLCLPPRLASSSCCRKSLLGLCCSLTTAWAHRPTPQSQCSSSSHSASESQNHRISYVGKEIPDHQVQALTQNQVSRSWHQVPHLLFP